MENPQKPINLDLILLKIKHKVETHFADKFVYAIPEWAMMTALPDIFATLKVHGKNGVHLLKQKVNFEFDFKSMQSWEFYADFLRKKMDEREKVVGYVFFFTENLINVKDVNYTSDLTKFQEEELKKFNQNQLETYGILITDKDLNVVESTDALLLSL
ncbi:hypothetical protein [Epilithonimonas sp.]|uniref:hypothetical protein n=1 Tax=Epilithonimonas sp. TaxID=2894511 RepID=UPI0028A286E7|nr:hypothetical protein [Epilithonimonas sp.]